MTRKDVPESARDMWWAQQQFSGIVNAVHEYADNEPDEGILYSTEVSVLPSKYDDVIEVTKSKLYYDRKEEGTWGWPLRCEVEWSRKMSFDEFRSSEWWKPYLERTNNLNFDSSWMDSFRVDYTEGNKYAEMSMRLPSEDRYRWRWSEGGTVEYSVYVCDDGTVGITRGDETTVERSVDEILGAVRFAERAQELGISISEGGRTIMIEKVDSDA